MRTRPAGRANRRALLFRRLDTCSWGAKQEPLSRHMKREGPLPRLGCSPVAEVRPQSTRITLERSRSHGPHCISLHTARGPADSADVRGAKGAAGCLAREGIPWHQGPAQRGPGTVTCVKGSRSAMVGPQPRVLRTVAGTIFAVCFSRAALRVFVFGPP